MSVAARRSFVPSRVLLAVAVGVAAPALVGLVAWGWWAGFVALRESRAELEELLVRRAELERVNRQLRRRLEGLQQEREARARAAREVLHAAAPDELIVVLPSPTPRVLR